MQPPLPGCPRSHRKPAASSGTGQGGLGPVPRCTPQSVLPPGEEMQVIHSNHLLETSVSHKQKSQTFLLNKHPPTAGLRSLVQVVTSSHPRARAMYLDAQ